jgi:putative ABC transport system permease protein
VFKNYLKTALRNLMRAKVFAAINIAGFAVGICAVIFILHYIQFHLSFNNYHEKADRIFRVSVISQIKGAADDDSYIFTSPIGEAMQKDFAEVESFVRTRTPRPANFTYNNQSYTIEDVTYADPSYFDIFTSQLVMGDRSSCLSAPYQIVLSKSTANKIFCGKNPVGQILSSNNNEYFTVSGVVEDAPKNSDLKFNGIISFATCYKLKNTYLGWNGGHQYITYVLLKNSSQKQSVEAKFPSFMWENINKDFASMGVKYVSYLQPLKDIHTEFNEDSKGLKTNIYIFSVVALFILALACINFINLFMSRAIKRNKEIGVRKVLGAGRKDVFVQFMSESFILIIISTITALLLCALTMPLYNRLTAQDFSFAGIFDLKLLGLTGIAMLLVCFLSAFYPSFVLSSFQPAQIMKKSVLNKPGRLTLKGSLVIFQFTISIALIICTFLINGQLDYIKTKALGFDKENQMIVPLAGAKMKAAYENIKAEMLKISGVKSVSASSEVPVNGFTSNGYFPEGFKNPVMINVVAADADYLSAYNIPIVAGRNFIGGSQADKDAYLVNEAFVKKMNWSNPIGKTVERDGRHQIVGVVKDFHFASLHDAIAPLIITSAPETGEYSCLTLKIKSSNLASVVGAIKDTYAGFSDGQPMDYTFLDESLNKVYKQEEIFREIFASFSGIAIVIALLGILGLTLFTVEQKKKEIAIRKVHGASISNISVLISKQFTMWILLANVIAWPSAYLFVKSWLNNFAYKADVSITHFIIAAVITLLIAWAIICYHTIKAAVNNPVESLKYE